MAHADGTASPVRSSRRGASGSAVHLSLDQVLDATAACLNESGYDGATIRDIARRLHCAVGSIYRYCPDKRALLATVTQRRFEPVALAVERGESLAHTLTLYATTAAQEPEQYRLMFWLASLTSPQSSNSHASTQSGTLPAVIERIIEGWTHRLGRANAGRRLWAKLHGGVMAGFNPATLAAELLPASDSRPSHAASVAASPAHIDPEAVEAFVMNRAPAPREDLTLL